MFFMFFILHAFSTGHERTTLAEQQQHEQQDTVAQRDPSTGETSRAQLRTHDTDTHTEHDSGSSEHVLALLKKTHDRGTWCGGRTPRWPLAKTTAAEAEAEAAATETEGAGDGEGAVINLVVYIIVIKEEQVREDHVVQKAVDVPEMQLMVGVMGTPVVEQAQAPENKLFRKT